MFAEGFKGECLCEQVSSIVKCVDIVKDDIFILDMIANEVVTDVDVFVRRSHSGIVCHGHCGLIVCMNDCGGIFMCNMKIRTKHVKVQRFLCGSRQCHVFSIS